MTALLIMVLSFSVASPQYALAADETWQTIRQYGSPALDRGESIAVDSGGNAYVAGTTAGTLPDSLEANAGSNDAFLTKFDSGGNRLWSHQLGTGQHDYGMGVAVDSFGSVYLTGYTFGTLPGSAELAVGGPDVFVAKFDSDGSRLWVRQLGSEGDDYAESIVVDAAGYAYVTGWTSGTLPGSPESNLGIYDAFVAKYDADGTRLWIHQLGTAHEEWSYAIAVDASGAAYITGSTGGVLPGSAESTPGPWDVFVAKFDTNGNRLWVRQLASNQTEFAYGVAVDSSGSAYIAGYTRGTLPGSPEANAGQNDVFIAKYDSGGNPLWVHELGASTDDYGLGVTVDTSGNAYVTGYSAGRLPGSVEAFAGGDDVFAAKYDTNGNSLWVHQLGTSGFDGGQAIAVDGFGRAYVTGYASAMLPGSSDPAMGSRDVFVATLAPTSGPDLPAVSIGDASLLEGDSGSRVLKLAVSLSEPATSVVSVGYKIEGVDAGCAKNFVADVDCNDKGGATGTVTFKPSLRTGKTPIIKYVAVKVYSDTTAELDETVHVTLSNASSGLSLGRSVGTGTILNDDGVAPDVTLGVGDGAIVKASAGSQNLTIPVTLSSSASGTVTVDYAVTPSAGTSYSKEAVGGGDIGGKTAGAVTFKLNVRGLTPVVRMISIPIWPGGSFAGSKSFTITLSAVQGNGVAVIRDTGTGMVLSG